LRLPVAERPDMPLVTDRAVGADQSGRFLLVVNRENVVEKRNVQLGQLVDGLRVIESGLGPEDRVVVSGIQRARPGAKVDPVETEMNTLTATAIAAKSREQNADGTAGEAATDTAVTDAAAADAAAADAAATDAAATDAAPAAAAAGEAPADQQ